jgi:hypothetical protein
MSVENSLNEEDHRYVCKFRDINDEKFLDLLPKLEIYIPTVAQLNDPLEGVLSGFSFQKSTPSRQEIQKYLLTVGVYSVSIHKKRWHASNFLPMWASYAKNHTGVCMVFKRKPLEDERFKWVKVEYVAHQHNHGSDQPFLVKSPTFTQDLFGNTQLHLSKKYDYWQYERELRLIAEPECTGRQAMDQIFDLNAVVFGFGAEKADILRVLNQLPNDTKEKLLKAVDMGIFRVIHPQPMRAQRPPQISPLEDLRPLLGLKPRLSFEWAPA